MNVSKYVSALFQALYNIADDRSKSTKIPCRDRSAFQLCFVHCDKFPISPKVLFTVFFMSVL